MNATEQKQLAAWDQCEASWVNELSKMSDHELRTIGWNIGQGNATQEQLIALTPVAFVGFMFAIAYELQRRNGGFGREEINPVADMTP
jgi:hypothetical protein